MDVTVLNMVACSDIAANTGVDLIGVGLRWNEPPDRMGIWIEFQNVSERAFSFSLRLMRKAQVLGESADELVLAGRDYWQGFARFEGLSGLPAKTYAVVTLIDGTPCHTINVDFGHPEGK